MAPHDLDRHLKRLGELGSRELPLPQHQAESGFACR